MTSPDLPVCPACGSTQSDFFATAFDAEYRTSDDRFTYVRCVDCGVVFMPEPPVDRLAEIYPPTYYSYSMDERPSLMRRIKERLDQRVFARILEQIPGDALSVLDVGGGDGALLTVIRDGCPRVAVTEEVDLDDGARERAERAGHVFHACPIEQLEIDRRFDLIIMLNIIEHVADPHAVMASCARLLAPGGRILVKTPNTDTLDCRLFRAHNWGGFHCPRHWVLFNRDNFRQLVERAGLRVVRSRYTQGAPQWTTSVLSTLHERGWISISRERPMNTHPLYEPLRGVTAALDFIRMRWMPTAQMIAVLEHGGAG